MKQIGEVRIYELKEVSDTLDIPEQTLRAKLRDGIIKGQKVGNKWYITEESIRDFFNGNPPPESTRYEISPEDNRKQRMEEIVERKRKQKEGLKEPEASTLEPIHTPPDGEDTPTITGKD